MGCKMTTRKRIGWGIIGLFAGTVLSLILIFAGIEIFIGVVIALALITLLSIGVNLVIMD